MAIPFGVKFSGYARYGAHFQSGAQKFVAVDGSYNGASAIGRLGNEGNGGKMDNDRTAHVNDTDDETLGDFNIGAMWEAWF